MPRDGIDLPGLVWTLVRTDFKVRYHGTALGFVWALLKPLAMFVVLISVFSIVFTQDPHYKLNLIIGLFMWEFFAEATKLGLGSLQAKAFLIGKSRFPRWIVVVTSVANPLITLMVISGATLSFLALVGPRPSLTGVLLFLGYVLLLGLIVIGFSLGASVLLLRLRDLDQVWEVVSQAGFFVAPIIYPLGILPERFQALLYLWPPTPVIEFSRAVLTGNAVPTPAAHAMLCVMAVTILATGAGIYRACAPRIAEHL